MQKVKQITNAARGFACNVETSSVCPFNCDGTRLLLLASNPPAMLDHFDLFDGTGNFIKQLSINASSRPRWSRQNPDMFTYIDGNTLRLYDVSNMQSTVIHQFEEYVDLQDKGEADSGDAGRVLVGMRPDGVEEIFIFSMETGKGPTYPQTDPYDGLKLTSDGKIILSRTDGIWVLE